MHANLNLEFYNRMEVRLFKIAYETKSKKLEVKI